MIFKKELSIGLVVLSLYADNILAQWPFKLDEMIVISSEINLRKEPSITSDLLMTVKNAEIVVPQRAELKYELIDNYNGYWIKVSYQGYIGYMYSKYLGPSYMLFYENESIDYLPKIKNWYGVYLDTMLKKEVIRKIAVHIIDENHELEKRMVLKTNHQYKSLFLIATNVDLAEMNIGKFINSAMSDNGKPISIKPGDDIWLYFNTIGNNVASTLYHLIGIGSYKIEKRLTLSDYQVMIVDNFNQQKPIVQDIGKFVGYPGTYSLKYCGDIDQDGIPDLIMSGCGNTSCIDVLYLSSFAKTNELVQPISFWYWPSDC